MEQRSGTSLPKRKGMTVLPQRVLGAFGASIIFAIAMTLPQYHNLISQSVPNHFSNDPEIPQREEPTNVVGGVEQQTEDSKDSNAFRLDFLVIPKTLTGREAWAIEAAAGEKNITWGYCHFDFKGETSYCPSLHVPDIKLKGSHDKMKEPWKLPMTALDPSMPNYNTLSVADYKAGRGKTKPAFFTVVKDPYERMITSYYGGCEVAHRSNIPYCSDASTRNDPETMNRILGLQLSGPEGQYRGSFTSYIPQHDYIFDKAGKQIVKHVLHYENLDDEFEALMKEYSLNISFTKSTYRVGQHDIRKRNFLTKADLNLPILRRIEELYEKDFELGNYTKISNCVEEAEAASRSFDSSLEDDVDHHGTRLEFIHIPKAAGTAVEQAGAKEGYVWGVCKFNLDNQITYCPPLHVNKTCEASFPGPKRMQDGSFWHLPMDVIKPSWKSLYNSMTEENFKAGEHKKKPVFFVVVRNPYERMISEYYYSCKVRNDRRPYCLHHNRNRPEIVNRILDLQLSGPNGRFRGHHTHYIPQHDYVFDKTGKRIVKHVLHFENLTSEFNALMKEYSLNISLPKQQRKYTKWDGDNLSALDLNSTTVRRIEELYGKDFELGNYSMISRCPELTPSVDIDNLALGIQEEGKDVAGDGGSRLEFIHIPLSAGNLIEQTGTKNGIVWGACHFNVYNHQSHCPPIRSSVCEPLVPKKSLLLVVGFDYQPISVLSPSMLSMYDSVRADDHEATEEIAKPVFFVVIRNPYERILSNYYGRCKTNPKGIYCGTYKKNDPKWLNKVIVEQLNGPEYGRLRNHPTNFIPQHDYVFDKTGKRIVKHVLRFENLESEFNALMKEYSLNISLPEGIRKDDNKSSNDTLSVKAFNLTVLRRIEEVYEKDFELGNYTKLSLGYELGNHTKLSLG